MGVGIAENTLNYKSLSFGLKEGLQWKVLLQVFTSWIVILPVTCLTTSGINGFLLPLVVPTPIVS